MKTKNLTDTHIYKKKYNNNNNTEKKKEEINLKKKEDELKFDCPEETHFFMVSLAINYKKLINNNF